MKHALLLLFFLFGCISAHAGMSVDGNGWTVITPSGTWTSGACTSVGCSCAGQSGSAANCSPDATQTRVMFVASGSTACSGSPCADNTACGTAAVPCATITYAIQHGVRGGSPDWVLARCGDSWTNDGMDFEDLVPGNNGSGKSTTEPMVGSNYDSGAANNPPVPDPYTCSARPIFNYNGSNPSRYCARGGTNNAFLGLVCYSPTRDPNSGSFSPTDSQANITGTVGFLNSAAGNILVEDVSISYLFSGITAASATYSPWWSHIELRRNEVFHNYQNTNTQESIGMGFFATKSSSPSDMIYYQNVVDHNGWEMGNATNSISWALPSGQDHNFYQGGMGINGNVDSLAGPNTFDGNIVINDGSASAFRGNGTFNNNLFMHNPRNLNFHQPWALTGTATNNVVVDGAATTSVSGNTGIELESRYINENIVAGGSNITGNIIANSPVDPNATGIIFDLSNNVNTGATGNTASGNYVYNWGYSGTSNALTGYFPGGVCGVSLNAAGSLYTDKSIAISAAASSNTVLSDGQNYVVVTVADNSALDSAGTVWISATGAGAGLSGPYASSALHDGTSVILYGTTFSGTFTGTLYYAYHQVNLTGGTGTGFQSDIISANGNIVAFALYGSDTPETGTSEPENDAGKSYTLNDVLTIPALPTGGSGTGSGGQLKVTTLCSNTIGTNALDPQGTNNNSQTGQPWPDPNRTPGAYYATLAGATANATFTATITPNTTPPGGVMNVTSITGTPLGLGDALKWSGQSKSEFIKGGLFGAQVIGAANNGSGLIRLTLNNPAALPFTTNDSVTVSAVGGTTEANGTWTITVPTNTGLATADFIDLQGSSFVHTYTSGGRAVDNSSPSATLCNVPPNSAACTGSGGTGTYAIAGNETLGSTTISSYTTQQLAALIDGQSKATWNPALTAPVINQFFQQGFGITGAPGWAPFMAHR